MRSCATADLEVMPRFDLVTIGSVLRDVTAYTTQGKIWRTPGDLTAQRILGFEYGAKVIVDSLQTFCGGGAANVAVSAASLGLQVAIVARIGADSEGAHLRATLRERGVHVATLQQDPKLPSGYSYLVCVGKNNHDHVAFVYRGANDRLTLDLKALKPIQPRWVYITAQSGPRWANTLRDAYAFARQAGAHIAFNPGAKQLAEGKRGLERYLQATDVLIVNKDEAIELALSGVRVGKRHPGFLNKPLYLLNILSEWGPKVVVITEGERGAHAISQGKVVRILAVRRRVVDTTGVGDAFGAAFVAGYLHTRGDLQRSLQWGAHNAAANLTKVGAQSGILTRHQMLEQLGAKS